MKSRLTLSCVSWCALAALTLALALPAAAGAQDTSERPGGELAGPAPAPAPDDQPDADSDDAAAAFPALSCTEVRALPAYVQDKGINIQIADFKGRWVYIEFWGSGG